MPLTIRIYATVDTCPSLEEIVDALEESEFEVTIETEDEEDDEWNDAMIYESSLDGPITLTRDDSGDYDEELEEYTKALGNGSGHEAEEGSLLHTLQNTVAIYGIEAPDEIGDEDNALLLCSIMAQILAQKTDGVYCVDGEGFFDETGELIFEVAKDD